LSSSVYGHRWSFVGGAVVCWLDLIEQMHEKGGPFEEAVLDAGMIRSRRG